MTHEAIYKVRSFFSQKKEPYFSLKNLLGFAPVHIEYYQLAMTHSSSNNGQEDKLHNNERLEFLGDSILDAVVSDILYKQFPEKREGDLTSMRSRLVQRSTLDKLGKKLGLDQLVMAVSKSTHVDKLAIHIPGNAFEALIGAIYLDRGYQKCFQFVQKLMDEKKLDVNQIMRSEDNYKSKFIEWTQHRKVNYEFKTTNVQFDQASNCTQFSIEVVVEGLSVGSGTGHSKKEAQQAACKAALLTIKRKSFKTKLTQIKPDASLQINAQEEDQLFTNK